MQFKDLLALFVRWERLVALVQESFLRGPTPHSNRPNKPLPKPDWQQRHMSTFP